MFFCKGDDNKWMKTKKKREQFLVADALFEMGMDFDVIETISGITSKELLLHKINLIEFDEKDK